MNPCVLIRHGETDLAGTFCGTSDPPLNAAGQVQIASLCDRLPFCQDGIYCSDLLRAVQSAKILSDHYDVPLIVNAQLREMDFGAWEGLRWDQIESRDAETAHLWMEDYPNGKIPGGEAYGVFQRRVYHAIKALLVEAERKPVLAVTHAGVMQTALCDIFAVDRKDAWEMTRGYASFVNLSDWVSVRR